MSSGAVTASKALGMAYFHMTRDEAIKSFFRARSANHEGN